MNKRIAIALLALVLAILACGSSTPTLKTTDDYMQEYGGKAEVYDRILALTDCAALQTEFDQAESNLKNQEPGTPLYKLGLGYMQASDDRMKAIGCDTSSNPPQNTLQPSTNAIVQVTSANSATAFILPTLTQPATPISAATSQPTATVIFLVTVATSSGGSGGSAICPCSGDTLNCGDFPTDPQAQACMNYCIQQGRGDIHNLDGDANGLACDGTEN